MSDVKPALGKEEWDAKRTESGEIELQENGFILVQNSRYENAQTENRHALAALALHGQPFGFTREDVDALETAITGVEGDGMDGDSLRSIKARIEALLPPD